MARKTPGLNTSSMSDISFLLLAFFLMVSNINSDMGIARKLPPPLPEDAEAPEVHQRNIFIVMVNKDDKLLFNDSPKSIDVLKDSAKAFLDNPYDSPSKPEKEEVDIDLLGKVRVSKGVISLRNDRGTSYDMYLQVQNELAAAINELRDEKAKQYFNNKHYADLNDQQRKAIDQLVPMAISEAEPTKIGGN